MFFLIELFDCSHFYTIGDLFSSLSRNKCPSDTFYLQIKIPAGVWTLTDWGRVPCFLL